MVQGVKYPEYLNKLHQPEAGKAAFNYLYKTYTKYGIPSDIAILIIKKEFFLGKGPTLLKEGVHPEMYTDNYNMRSFWEEIRKSLKKR